MNRLKIVLVALVCAVSWAAAAQDTNSLKTQIGQFETRTDVVLVKGFGLIGSISVGAEQLSLRSKETSDLATGDKAYGLAIEVSESQYAPLRLLVDDDEVDGLLRAVNDLIRINYDVTSLPGFEASFTTRSGFRVVAHSDRKEGGLHNYVQFGDYPRIALSSVQMTQLYGLIEQGQKSLAALKSGK